MVKEIDIELEKLKKTVLARFSGKVSEEAVKGCASDIDDHYKRISKVLEKELYQLSSLREENDILRSISGIDEMDMKVKFLEKAAEIKFLRDQVLSFKKQLDKSRNEIDEFKQKMEESKQYFNKRLCEKDEKVNKVEKEYEEFEKKYKHLSDTLDKNRDNWEKEKAEIVKKKQDYETYVRSQVESEVEALSERLRDLCGILSGTAQYCVERWGEISSKKTKSIKSAILKVVEKTPLAEISPDLAVVDEYSLRITKTLDLYQGLSKVPKPDWQKVEWQQLWDNFKRKYYEVQVKKQIKLVFPSEKKYPIFISDASLILEISEILLKNAIESVVEKGTIEILGKFDDEQVILTFNDSGKSVKPENREKIFLPFFTTKPGRDGMGLAKAVKLVQHIGGRIKYEPKPGGNTFVVTIPSHK